MHRSLLADVEPPQAPRSRRSPRTVRATLAAAALLCLTALAAALLGVDPVSRPGAGSDTSRASDRAGAGTPPPRPSEEFRLAHRDDFDVLDTETWAVYDGPGNGRTGPRSSANTFVDDGTLVLRTAPVDGQWRGAGVSSAPGGWTQTYGKYLVRLRFEEGYGVRAVALLWPTSPWPPEVDFFEVPATVEDRSSGILTNHYSDASGRRKMERLRVRADFTQWHTVGVEWTPESLTYTLDGEVVGQVTRNVPDEPMWLGVQTAQGLIEEGIVPDESRTPSVDLFVDWVEVHRYTGPVPSPDE